MHTIQCNASFVFVLQYCYLDLFILFHNEVQETFVGVRHGHTIKINIYYKIFAN